MPKTLLGGLAAGALVLSAVSGSTTAVATGASGAKCRPGVGSARVADGTSRWRDPNTLTRAEAAAMQRHSQRIVHRAGLSTAGQRPDASVKIQVYYHVMTKRDGTGNVPYRQLKRQTEVLNDGFAGRTSGDAADTPFRFRIADIQRVPNNDWYRMDFADYREAGRALRVGDARALNVYIANLSGGLLGFAYFPESYQRHPKRDGVALLNESLPGGSAAPYNRGDTATHEVGHWLNLYHTFQGGCSVRNDYITDTPRQRAGNNVFKCNPKINTCGRKNGPHTDPVYNFMNYTDDPCIREFTRGQRDRMDNAWYIREALSSDLLDR